MDWFVLMNFKPNLFLADIGKCWWALAVDDVLRIFRTDDGGLSSEEAGLRLKSDGRNVIADKEGRGVARIVLSQFVNPLILVLVFAGVVTLALGDFTDSVFIFAAVLVNAALGFYQEFKAETAIKSLRTYIRERARVVRGGKEFEVDAEEIVVGDVIRLVSGSRVPADARLMSAADLSIDESILTGEAMFGRKKAGILESETPLPDRDNMVYGGTFVAFGSGTAAIIATGAETEIGRIALLVRRGRETTPLQKAFGDFALRASGFLIVFTIALFFVGLRYGYKPIDMFVVAVAVGVSAVPEGLPIALTVILAVGVERLAKRRGVVRKLLAAETLGRTTVIMTDKTGTLTEARLTLDEIVAEGDKERVLEYALLPIDATVENPEAAFANWRIIGRPLERALVIAAAEHRVLLHELKGRRKVLSTKPFSSEAKYSSAEVQSGARREQVFLGAPEVVVGKVLNMDAAARIGVCDAAARRAVEGKRVLAVATEHAFLGLLIFKDPVRACVRAVVERVRREGTRVILVTGDHAGTALAVARETGIVSRDGEVLSGSEIAAMSDADLARRLASVSVIARAVPEDKVRLVRIFQGQGAVVAMTGDGVNDAPALKEADIGVAVGSGTDVAKGAADLVILDDNFETLISAIDEGRNILENIRKTVVYLFSSILDELVLVGGALVAGLPLPLSALQILWVNFFADSLPAVAFAFEKQGSVHFKRRERGFFDREMKFFILVIGTLSSFLLFALYSVLISLGHPLPLVRTFIFASFGLYSLFLVFPLRNLRAPIFRYNPFGNGYLSAGVVLGAGLMVLAVYAPAVQGILGTVPLPPLWAAAVFSVCLLNIAAVEFGKWLFRSGR